MKRLLLASLATTALATAIAGQTALATDVSYSTLGVVQKIDRSAAKATIAHEPVPALGWPKMTMQFAVKEQTLFERLPAGRQVAFEFVAEDGAYRIVNAIPLAGAAGAAAPGDSHSAMQGGMAMGGMSNMREMCMDMMGQKRGGKR